MFRQTAFGVALSTLVLASGLTANSVPGHTSTNQILSRQALSGASQQIATSENVKTTDLEKSVLEQINRYRIAHGLPALTINQNISRQARVHSQQMAEGQVPFSHDGFKKRVNAIPLRYQSAAENVAFNQGYNDPAAQAMLGWLNSPGHLSNIHGDFNLTGIGVAKNSQGEVYITQIFLRSHK
ncbi:CAP domain-containing protein [Calothrix sp. 336/3]|uniref:CAP domain-containing protein n=1 Tax=Calothrix sp. 336/3 TaxID=1337936 RepID=UPI0004E45A4D|nr:CAP domain-containing protein [Calothrix sp. 336/3]AKG20826.1 alkaline phosphatase [Calothrix sp. 336/3]